jgi:hypothetical protein
LAPCYGATRERLSVCLFSGALGVNFRICRFGCALGSEAILLRARLVFGRDQPRNGFAEVRLAGGTCATEPPEWPAMGGAVPGDTGTASIGNV